MTRRIGGGDKITFGLNEYENENHSRLRGTTWPIEANGAQHALSPYHGDWVDLALAGNVGRRAVDGLVQMDLHAENQGPHQWRVSLPASGALRRFSPIS
jgi:hypothetical protein